MGFDGLGTVQSLDDVQSSGDVSSLHWFELGYYEDGRLSPLATNRR